MEQTTNYQLSQWDEKDRILREDFNADNAKTEQALAAQQDSIAAVAAQAGNCEMTFLTYTGNGNYNGTATRITFPVRPDAYLVAGDNALLIGQGGGGAIMATDDVTYSGCSVGDHNTSWDGNTLVLNNSVNARYQMNTKGKSYWVLAFKRKNS